MALHDPMETDLSGQDCTSCLQFKTWDQFYARGRQCRSCIIRQTSADRREVPGWGAIRQAACRARAKGLPFDLYDYKDELFARFLTGCELTGLPFNFERRGKGGKWDSPSIDRIKPELGYAYTNVRVILFGLNAALNIWGEDKLEIITRAWLARKDGPC